MKKILTLFAVIGLVAFSSCEGPEGPPGVPGQDGQDGLPGNVNEIFEVTLDFNNANNYGRTYVLDPVIAQGDNLLVYELVNTNDGIDTWALLPQVYYLSNGSAQYNFSFSYDQFSIFIDSDFDPALLPAAFTTNKTFRVVILPGAVFGKSVNKADYSDYNAVIKKYNIDDSNVKKLN
ncbi:hypothetical protein [Flavobacterium ginsenosidimutans]|uniref:Dihydrolipoamide dehydrogenase n=1 Tax=Flavobacterium ginsenosidimutans TaxID=687844 RepID=A0ABZ2Q902_9FLAO|nr:hypothetical protein [Flavobacterium ginsenosidimutans]KAF2331874.1 hypothetical protein DM444_11780 [Flavobacterium ginsenosidimutans]